MPTNHSSKNIVNREFVFVHESIDQQANISSSLKSRHLISIDNLIPIIDFEKNVVKNIMENFEICEATKKGLLKSLNFFQLFFLFITFPVSIINVDQFFNLILKI